MRRTRGKLLELDREISAVDAETHGRPSLMRDGSLLADKRAALDAEYGNASDRYENLSRQYRAPGPRTNIWTAVDEAAPLARPDATGHLRLR